jgi:L-alanine-DL-glutamate epimerase-like enolase superfamily enzyme
MKITAIETYQVSVPLKPEYRMITALGLHDVSDYLLVRVRTAGGLEGAGEATVSEKWSGETVWGAKALIDRRLAPAVLGCDASDTLEVDRRMDAVARGNWFAKSAIEMACWDIQGKAAQQPIFELLGGPHRSLSVRCRFSMGAFEPAHAARRAEELLAEGFDTIKVKVGTVPGDDLARVRAVRNAIGPETRLMIDANCGWDVETAIRCIHELEDCDLWMVEQPTPDGDYEGLARVRRETRPPVMADDICFDLVHARELIRNECCDVISIYPGKNGGIRKAKEIAELAARHGIACSIGSNLEYDVATAAMAHLVVGTENLRVEDFPGDMLGPVYHTASVVKQPIDIAGPMVTLTDAPGLGVEVDWEALK